MFLLTAVSWLGALLVAKFLRMTAVKGESTPFVMELPPYRLPTLKGILIHTWERTWQYIKKAGTVILGISILLWAMMTFPHLPEEKAEAYEKERQAVLVAAQETEPVDETLNHLKSPKRCRIHSIPFPAERPRPVCVIPLPGTLGPLWKASAVLPDLTGGPILPWWVVLRPKRWWSPHWVRPTLWGMLIQRNHNLWRISWRRRRAGDP